MNLVLNHEGLYQLKKAIEAILEAAAAFMGLVLLG